MTLNCIRWWEVSSKALTNVEHSFIATTFRSTLTRSGSTWQAPIYGSNRTIWHLNWEQTNDLCQIELEEIELFDHLAVGKKMTDIYMNS